MAPAKKPPSPRLPCTGHQKESEGRVVQRSHGDGQWRKKLMRQMGKTWSSISVIAKHRQKWKDHVASLHATRRNGHECVSE